MDLEDDQRKGMTYGKNLNHTFEGKDMHFFNAETEQNLLV